MSQVLARKWRPKAFSELVGQEHVVRALTNALEQQRLHHAYLFTGTRGVGKTTLARIIAKALNCETGVTATPCGTCGACQEIDAGRFVDLIELDAASNTQVDNMRELLDNAVYAPTRGRYKVYLIDEVHMLSRSAFNAMLKTLEEPPLHVKFILATTDPQKIPLTVLSRCLQFSLKQIPPPQIREQLRRVLEAEKVPYEEPALALLAKAAQGSMRDSLSMLDQAIAHGSGRVEEDAVRAMLGAADQGSLHVILRALGGGDGAAMIAEADRMAGLSLSFEAALQDMATLLHRLALIQRIPEAVADDDPDRQVLVELSGLFAADELQLYYQIAVQGRGDIGLAPDEYAGFTMTLLRMLAFAPEVPGTRARAPEASRLNGTPKITAGQAKAAPIDALQPERNSHDATWGEIVNGLRVTGMTRMLAQHCELITRDEGRIELGVAKVHEKLLEKSYREKLKVALQRYLGRELRVVIRVGEGSGNSLAEIADREKRQHQTKAIAEIEQDPFVRELVENFDARVDESTIKPIQQEGER